jgi:hypothetical protein
LCTGEVGGLNIPCGLRFGVGGFWGDGTRGVQAVAHALEYLTTTITIPFQELRHTNNQRNGHLYTLGLPRQMRHHVQLIPPGPHPEAPGFATGLAFGGPLPPNPCSTLVVAGG